MSLVMPIVHMNGTSRRELTNLRYNAAHKIREALEALSEMAPNGRDYYPEPGRLEQALEQHLRRVRMLTALQKEIDAELIALEER